MLFQMLAMVAAPPQLTWWCTTALQNVFRDTPAPNPAINAVLVSAARSQTVGAQIVLMPTRAGQVERLECSPLRGPRGARIPATAFTYSFVEYQHVEKNSKATPPEELARRAPADFPDALSQDSGIALETGRNQPVWVAVTVPADARAGEYRGDITVKLAGGALRVPVRLTVYDFALPERTRLAVTIWINTDSLAKHQGVKMDSEEWWALLRRTARLMRAHHQNTIITSWGLIDAQRGSGNRTALDFGRFDRWVETFLSEGFERIELGHMGGREHGEWEDKTFVASKLACRTASGGQEQLEMEEWLPALESHLREKGWLDRSVLHIADEPIPVNEGSWKQLSDRVHRCAPALRRIDAVHVPDLAGHLEVFVPQLNYLEQWLPTFQQAQKNGAELWYYTAWVPQGRYPNRLMDYPLIKTRMLHLLNYTTGTTGYLHWGFNFWDVPFDQFSPGDNEIVWPGKETPKSTLRYEAMREGIEDYEYLRLLQDAAERGARKQHMPGFDARGWTMAYARRVAPGIQAYTRDPAVLYDMRDRVARAIDALNRGATLSAVAGSAATGPTR